jgi:hypothetical protein
MAVIVMVIMVMIVVVVMVRLAGFPERHRLGGLSAAAGVTHVALP